MNSENMESLRTEQPLEAAAPENRTRAPAAPPPETGPDLAGKQKKKKPSALKALLRFLVKLLILAALGWALLTWVLGIFVVHDNNMFPTLRDGDLLITYRLQPISRGAVVAYTVNGERRFGRVAGVAGDVIEMDGEGHYTVNGGVPYETIYYDTRSDEGSDVFYPYTVPEDSLFILNDLRDNSDDSRRFGAVDQADTDGCAALQLRRRGW